MDIDLEKELKRAQAEYHSGSPENALAILIELKGRFEHAKISEQFTAEHRIKALIKILNNLGVVQKNFGALEDATSSLEEALRIANVLGDEGVRMRCGILSNLGLLYSRRKEYKKGLDTFNKAVDLANSHPKEIPTSLKVKLYNNRALFFVRFGEPDLAREELSHALESAHDDAVKGDAVEREAWLTANLAMVHAELGGEEVFNQSRQNELYRQANNMFMHSADLYHQVGYTQHRLKQLLNAAEINIRLRALEEASRLLSQIEGEARRISNPRILCEVSQMNLELALIARDRTVADRKLSETVKLLKELNPPDLQVRYTRLEGVLRRHGRTDAIKVVAELSAKKTDRPSGSAAATHVED